MTGHLNGATLALAILIKPHLIWLLLKAGSPVKEISSELLSRISNNININYTYYTYIKYNLYIYNINYTYTQRVRTGHILKVENTV